MLTYIQVLENLLATARDAGLSEEALARAANVPPESISLCKRPSSQDLATLNLLAEVLDITISLSPAWKDGPPEACPTWILTPRNPGRWLH